MPEPETATSTRTSVSTASDASPLRRRPPISVHAVAAIAWLVACLCFVIAAGRYGSWGDVTFYTVLGGWAAYLGLALTRGVTYAWKACRLVTLLTVGFNVMFSGCMTMLLLADTYGLRDPPFNVSWDRTLAFMGFAVVMTVGPLAIFKALSQGSVKRWFGLEDEDGLPVVAAA